MRLIVIYSFFGDSTEPWPDVQSISDEQIEQIKNNDSTLTELSIYFHENGLDDASIDWNEMGRLISKNTHLKQLKINAFAKPWKDINMHRDYFNNVGLNESIECLILNHIKGSSKYSMCLTSLANLRCLKITDCEIGGDGYIALGQLLRSSKCQIQELVIEGGDFSTSELNVSTVRDGLTNNTTLKKLKVLFITNQSIEIAWTCRNSSIEELDIQAPYATPTGLSHISEFANVLKTNTTLKKLTVGFGNGYSLPNIVWDAFILSLRTNTSLTELDLSHNQSINNEVLTSLMNVLANNTTLTTLRLESLGQVTRDGWRSIATNYIRSPTCALENLYLGGNRLDSTTFRELGSACYPNRTLKKLCLKLPSNRSLNTPRVGWNPWTNSLMRIIYNKQSIMETFNSNHVLETICYPEEEDRFVSAMASSPLMGKGLPSALQMNREDDKFTVARRKILQSHYYNQDDIKENKEYRGYKTLMDTILEMTDDMERTEQLPNIMSWVGRDNDGLTLMYELLQRAPTLCENVGGKIHADTSVKRMRVE